MLCVDPCALIIRFATRRVGDRPHGSEHRPMQQDSAAASRATPADTKQIRHLRQILLWPVHLLPLKEEAPLQHHWEHLAPDPTNPWRELDDEFGDPGEFQERHYNEFVTFLPPVQRFLYGQGIGRAVRRSYGESPIRVMRRSDIASVRLTLDKGAAPIELKIIHVDLYFFFDIDIAILALEVAADDIELGVAQEALFRFGRAYPAYWEQDCRGGHCPWLVEWLSPKGETLARSDYERREKYLSFVCQHRAPAVASHWEFLLSPLVLHHSDRRGLVRYRQLEYYRMPYMAFFAMENPSVLTRPDLIRMGIGNEAGASSELPYSESYLGEFEERFCYDRYCDAHLGKQVTGTRFMCTGHTLVVIGEAKDRFFMNADGGFLGRFRHQHFLLFLVAHFQRAALHMFSDRLVAAVSKLDITDAEANRVFRRDIRHALENFLRFEHRYWFYEISNQAQARELYAMTREHLALDALYRDIREERRHGKLPRRGGNAAAERNRGAADRGHHLWPDRHGVHWVPRHESAGVGRPSARTAGSGVLRRDRRHHDLDRLHRGQISPPVRVFRRAL